MNKTIRDIFTKFAVKLCSDSGSGCLFQPPTNEYSYILTAKHVVEGITPVWAVYGHTHDVNQGEIHSEDIYLHPTKDAALIKISRVNNLPKLKPSYPKEREGGYLLQGYPDCRKEGHNQYRANEVTIINPETESGHIEIEIRPIPILSEVKGMSGGGIIKGLDSDNYLLAGIQEKMVTENELQGRALVMPIIFFDEIIKLNPTLASLSALSIPSDELELLIKVESIFLQWTVLPIECQEAIFLLRQLKESIGKEKPSNMRYKKDELFKVLIMAINAYSQKALDPKNKSMNEAIQNNITELMDLYRK